MYTNAWLCAFFTMDAVNSNANCVRVVKDIMWVVKNARIDGKLRVVLNARAVLAISYSWVIMINVCIMWVIRWVSTLLVNACCATCVSSAHASKLHVTYHSCHALLVCHKLGHTRNWRATECLHAEFSALHAVNMHVHRHTCVKYKLSCTVCTTKLTVNSLICGLCMPQWHNKKCQ